MRAEKQTTSQITNTDRRHLDNLRELGLLHPWWVSCFYLVLHKICQAQQSLLPGSC
ncbi:hypothetical protein OIU79_028291 [Salix purpurea]|uniref:Uncharacterized protein n=1 Tax=Salix purpurea TaxID=77065 RepID=A0A9Q1A2G9_SALPP|nr:hypothetical protein OIU79_028291 [Salix purpurea]